MINLGIDCHKVYSKVAMVDERGELIMEINVLNKKATFDRLAKDLKGPARAVIEAGYNWGLIYDILTELNIDVTVAHPLRVKAIASAQIKTDTIDARTLAYLLHANLIPEVYVPPKAIRKQKDILRQRCWLVRLQTALKNRIHQILARNHVENLGFKDLFGVGGMRFLTTLSLPNPDQKILQQDLAIYNVIHKQIKITTQWVNEALSENRYRTILLSLPGLGEILSALVALEIADIKRFAYPAKLSAYAGLVPTTYASGGKVYHGDLLPQCNRYLRYAFIEASWVAIRSSLYFNALFTRIKKRKGPNTAIVVVARRLCEIAYQCLKEDRLYEERPYRYYNNYGA